MMDSTSRPCIVAGNWKMHKTIAETQAFVTAAAAKLNGIAAQLYLAVPATAIQVAKNTAAGSAIVIGAQNMHDAPSGAFTGELSAEMVQEAGAQFVILGHSERRHVFGEDSAFINRKVLRALECGLQPIVCCGETLQQREAGEMEQLLDNQLSKSLKDVSAEQLRECILAYEPVWAIGTGRTATAAQAQEAHLFIRNLIAERWDQDTANNVVIQYGGSVKASNAAELLALPDVDGVLVGGASLDPDSFIAIASAYQSQVT